VSALSPTRAAQILRRAGRQRILVVGDVMLDEFIWGRVSRISPEAPVPVVEVSHQTFHLGGAANVAANVRALGGAATVAGVVGQDAAGSRVREELSEAGIEASLAASDSGRPTTVKTRIIAHSQQVVRADRERSDEIPPALEEDLLARVRSCLPGTGAVVLSDYQKGVVTRRLARSVFQAARRRGIPVLVDPKVRHFGLYRGAWLVTPNQLEAEQASGLRIRSPQELAAAAARLLKQLRCEGILVTRGEQGMSLFRPRRRALHIPATAREVYDVTGAGDTVIATLALALAGAASLEQAAQLANAAAGVVVAKLGTATASAEEVVAALEQASA
jgi:rfaE bifunctional protein kinase chain/domain